MVVVTIDLSEALDKKVELYKVNNQCRNRNRKLDKRTAIIDMIARFKE